MTPGATWSRPVAAGAAVVLAALACAAALRALGAWVGRAVPVPASPRPAAASVPRRALPLVPPDPRRILVDLVLPGAPAPRLVALPAGARLADLLAAGGLAGGLAVEGGGEPRAPLPAGRRLEVTADGRARLVLMPALRRLRLGLPLDLDHDDAEALALLPGIGPRLAAAIVADRARRGPFGSLSALTRVRGIGPGTAAGLVGRVSADPAPSP